MGVVLHNQAVEHNVGFSEPSLAIHNKESKWRLVPWVIALIQCQVVNSSSKDRQYCGKCHQVSAKLGLLSIACVGLGVQKVAVILSCSRVSSIQGLLKYWSEWKDSQDFWNCLLYCRCPLFRDSTVYIGNMESLTCLHYSSSLLCICYQLLSWILCLVPRLRGPSFWRKLRLFRRWCAGGGTWLRHSTFPVGSQTIVKFVTPSTK